MDYFQITQNFHITLGLQLSNFNPEFLPFTFKDRKDNNRLTRLITPHFQAIYFTYLANNLVFHQKNNTIFSAYYVRLYACTIPFMTSILARHHQSVDWNIIHINPRISPLQYTLDTE